MPLDLDKALENLAHQVIGAAIEVRRTLGPGYLESVYEKALCIELGMRNIEFRCQVPTTIKYKGTDVGDGRIDLLVDGLLLVELKTVDALTAVHQAQVISYLKATNKKLGLLINFNTAVLKDGIRRVVL